jgi:hypothetical protein
LENRLSLANTLAIGDGSVLEPRPGGTVDMDFTVTRSGDLTAPVTVGYTTVPGMAQSNRDFSPTTGTVLFPPGAATEVISIPVFGNGVYALNVERLIRGQAAVARPDPPAVSPAPPAGSAAGEAQAAAA